MQIDQWKGLMTDPDPHDIPPGAAVVQENLRCISPGKLSVRGGLGNAFNVTGAVIGMAAYQTPLAHGVVYQVGTAVYIADEDLVFSGVTLETGVATSRPSCWCQAPNTHLIRVNGLQRGTIFNGDTVQGLGIYAPTTAPTVTPVGSGGAASEGTYWCAYRYKDKEGVVSNLSPLLEVTAALNDSFTWGFLMSYEGRVAYALGGKIQLFRTLVNRPDVFYLVAEVNNANTPAIPPAPPGPPSYSDTMSDAQLLDEEDLPFLYGDERPCANRFGVPPINCRVAVPFLNRIFYGVPEPINLYDYTVEITNWAVAIIGQWIYTESEIPGEVISVSGSTLTLSPTRTVTVSAASEDIVCAAPNMQNSIWYSEDGEPEAVAEDNVFPIQVASQDNDRQTAMIQHGSILWIMKERHAYRFTYVNDPARDGQARLGFSRGCINQNCWDFYQDSCFVLDAIGPWMMQGEEMVPLGDVLGDIFRDGTIDFSKRDWFFVAVEPTEAVARFFVAYVGDTYTQPTRVLCYGIRSQTWWTETYPYSDGLGGAARIMYGGANPRPRCLLGGGESVIYLMADGLTDYGDHPIAWSYKSGILALQPTDRKGAAEVRKRTLAITYKPTTNDGTLTLRVYRDHETAAETFRAPYDVGGGVTAAVDGTAVVVDLKRTRSGLANAPGYQSFSIWGATGGDLTTQRFVQFSLEGEQEDDEIAIYAVDIEGV